MLLASEWYEIAPGWLGLAVGAWVAFTVHRWQSRETARARLHGMIGGTCDVAIDLAESIWARASEYFAATDGDDNMLLRQDLLTSLKVLGRQVTDIRHSCRQSDLLKSSRVARGLPDQYEAFKASITGEGFLIVDPSATDERRARIEEAGASLLDALRSARRRCGGV